MANTEYNTLLTGTGNISKSALINALEQRGIYVIEDGETPTALTPGAATHLAYRGLVFWYDSTDSTTAHDGVTCIVTADGKRFKSDGFAGAQSRFFAVEDKDLTAPPGSPTIGDSYIVGAGSTGAWATHDDEIATYTARGWKFNVANAYDIAIIIDESAVYHFSAGGSWTSGFPFFTIGANTVLPSHLKYGRFGHSVVNQTTNTPPGSPSDGDTYVIGGTPTGVWTGHARKIAIYESSAWVIYTPYEGATVYDLALNIHYVYDGSAWVGQASGYTAVTSVFTSTLITGLTNITGYTYSATTAPTTAAANEPDTVGLAHSARAAGKVLEITYECDFYYRNNSGSALALISTVGLQVDSDAAMVDWARLADTQAVTISTGNDDRAERLSVTFFVTVADASSHTYTPRFFANTGTNWRVRFSRRRIIIRERA